MTAPESVVRLSAASTGSVALAVGKAVLVIGAEPVAFELTAPAGPCAVEDVLPILQGLSSLFAERAAARAQAEGRPVSCRAGCGACCRQLVPIAPAEARALARLVEAMPAPRQAEVRQRFEAAIEGLADRVEPPFGAGLDYFHQGVACPFLENEFCSIHADRPLSCREYLVTSPVENCRSPTPEGIDKLTLEGEPSLALLKADLRDGWFPLVLALRFDASAPPSPRDRPGPEILRDVLGRL